MMNFFVLLLIGYSCEKYVYEVEEIDPNEDISFQEDIIPIFNSKCARCHNADNVLDLSEEVAYNSLFNGNYISDDPVNNPEESIIYSTLQDGAHAAYASDTDKQKLLNWISQGAENN